MRFAQWRGRFKYVSWMGVIVLGRTYSCTGMGGNEAKGQVR